MFVKAFNISQVERKEFTDNLIEASAPRFDFYFLVIEMSIYLRKKHPEQALMLMQAVDLQATCK